MVNRKITLYPFKTYAFFLGMIIAASFSALGQYIHEETGSWMTVFIPFIGALIAIIILFVTRDRNDI